MATGAHARESSPISTSTEAGAGDNSWPAISRSGCEDGAVYTKTGRIEMTKYTVYFESTATGYSAHVPDLPGCVAAAGTMEETRELIREAIEFHLEGMLLLGQTVPTPTSHVEQIEIAV